MSDLMILFYSLSVFRFNEYFNSCFQIHSLLSNSFRILLSVWVNEYFTPCSQTQWVFYSLSEPMSILLPVFRYNEYFTPCFMIKFVFYSLSESMSTLFPVTESTISILLSVCPGQ